MSPTTQLTSNSTTDYHILQTRARAKYSVHCSLIHSFLLNKFRHPERSRGTLHKLPLPLPDASKTPPPLRVPRSCCTHLCRWQRALATTPSLNFAGGSQKCSSFFAALCFELIKKNAMFYFLINIRIKKNKKKKAKLAGYLHPTLLAIKFKPFGFLKKSPPSNFINNSFSVKF
jgi:hypothetical protein